MKSPRLMAAVLGAVLSAAPALAQKQQINGAGATFPYPIYSSGSPSTTSCT
jgi:ABC-type phosphate transport system substrate-binding protein